MKSLMRSAVSLLLLVTCSHILASETPCGKLEEENRPRVRSESNVDLPMKIGGKLFTIHFKEVSFDKENDPIGGYDATLPENLSSIDGASLIKGSTIFVDFKKNGLYFFTGLNLVLDDKAVEKVPYVFPYWKKNLPYKNTELGIVISQTDKKICFLAPLLGSTFRLAKSELKEFKLISHEMNDWTVPLWKEGRTRITKLKRHEINDIAVTSQDSKNHYFAIDESSDGSLYFPAFRIEVKNQQMYFFQTEHEDNKNFFYAKLTSFFDYSSQRRVFERLTYKYNHHRYTGPVFLDGVLTPEGLKETRLHN